MNKQEDQITKDQGKCNNCWMDNIPSLNNFAQEIKDQLAASTITKTYRKGDLLVRAGDSGVGIFCILEGLVKVSKTGHREKEFILWIAEEGNLVGLNSFTDNEPYSFNAVALNNVTACFIPAAELRAALQKEPAFTLRVMQYLCQELDHIEQRITSISRKKKRAQCAEILLSIVEKNHTGNRLQVDYSISDLSSFVGTTKNYLYKIITEFTKKDILSIRNRKLVVTDIGALSLISMEKD